jgi:glutamate-1-semialdehyde 2,1-aminomutase
MKTAKSRRLYAEAKKVIPGGVNSPVRAFRAVGLEPLFVSKAKGSKVYDADGGVYIDYVSSWGPMILGHAHPQVRKAMSQVLSKGWSYGAATELEVRLAQRVSAAIPSMELMRMVSSGTEAAMSALRVARGFTGRDKIIKFEGCYHGHADSFLVKAGSGVITFGIPDSAGVPASLAANTLVAPYNDLEAVRALFNQNPSQIACVVVEPIAGNMGIVLPREGFLKGLEEVCRNHGALLIFDEVITGFRLAYGGVQKIFGITPDLTCLGKIIGGGMPVGAYGGRREIMEKIAPLGPIYQAGTLSGNPLAMTCGLATLDVLRQKGVYKKLDLLAEELCQGLEDLTRKKGIPARINRSGSMFTLFFTGDDVFDYSSAKKADAGKYAKYFQGMLQAGVWLPPSQFEACFVSLAHTARDIEGTLKAAASALEFLS